MRLSEGASWRIVTWCGWTKGIGYGMVMMALESALLFCPLTYIQVCSAFLGQHLINWDFFGSMAWHGMPGEIGLWDKHVHHHNQTLQYDIFEIIYHQPLSITFCLHSIIPS